MGANDFEGSDGGPLPRQACPSCDGSGELMALVDGPKFSGPRQVMCSCCRGVGTISSEHADRIRKGKGMRDTRVSQRRSLREAARERGISAAELSRIERGDGPAEYYN